MIMWSFLSRSILCV